MMNSKITAVQNCPGPCSLESSADRRLRHLQAAPGAESAQIVVFTAIPTGPGVCAGIIASSIPGVVEIGYRVAQTVIVKGVLM
jgi:hypothetical protein